MRSDTSPLGNDEARRFRPLSDWFVASGDAGVHVARIGATAERAVDLMHALTTHLDPAVDVVMTDVRSGMEWQGFDVPLPDLRDALGRLRFPLATYGGVEMTVFGPDDQLSLTPELLLVIYAHSDRWYFLLEGLGLAERAEAPMRVWTPSRSNLAPSPELASALAAAAARLGLRAGAPTSVR
jgi:hypothetical protein